MDRAFEAAGEIARELLFVGGFIGGLWLASYLYELGFLARFGVPIGVAEIGFPRIMALLLLLAPAGALVAASALALAGSRSRDLRRIFLPAAGTATLGLILAADLAEPSILPARLVAETFELDIHPAALALLVSLAVYAARLGGRCLGLLRRGDAAAVAQSALVIVLLMLLPAGLGWFGAGKKAAARGTFLYLVGQEEFVLVRLYDENAVFVRYDRERQQFEDEHLVRRIGGAGETLLTFRPRR